MFYDKLRKGVARAARATAYLVSNLLNNVVSNVFCCKYDYMLRMSRNLLVSPQTPQKYGLT